MAAPLVAGVSFTEDMIQDDTAIRIINGGEGANFTGFLVGVRTKIKCTDILVTVFYRTTILVQEAPMSVLLSQEYLAPCAGWHSYGMTRRDFTMPKDSVQFIGLKFLEEIGDGRREFGREK